MDFPTAKKAAIFNHDFVTAFYTNSVIHYTQTHCTQTHVVLVLFIKPVGY